MRALAPEGAFAHHQFFRDLELSTKPFPSLNVNPVNSELSCSLVFSQRVFNP
jgi:hypothetical protein